VGSKLIEGEMLRLRIFRYDPAENRSPRYATFEVPYESHMTVLDALYYIHANLDSSLAFRWGCRTAKCGECGLKVNGKPTLACKEAIRTRELLIEPLSPFPIVRDLVIDRSGMEDRIAKNGLFLSRGDDVTEEPEPIPIEIADRFVHLNKCIDCYACISACPMISSNEDVSHGFASPVLMNRLAKLAVHPRDIRDRATAAYSEGVYSCTLCGGCQEICPYEIETPSLSILYLRQLLIEKGLVPRTAQDALTNTYKYGNPWKKQGGRSDWTEELDVKYFSKGENAELLLYVGCTGSYDPRIQGVIRSLAFILGAAGVDFGILGDEERCCGSPMLRLGEKGLFDLLAEENMENFERYGIDHIVTLSPHSYNAFSNDYPEKGLNVQHYTELLSELIDEGRVRLNSHMDALVTYHDSCYLGRCNGIYEPPRKILESIPGISLIEMPRNRETSFCCGGGGGMMWVDDLSEERASARRAREAANLEPDIVATSCPFCLINLEDGVKAIGKDGRIQVKDIAELVKIGMNTR
jgi:succinate dehydrogenase/fumarate reductase iron-sulfur protein